MNLLKPISAFIDQSKIDVSMAPDWEANPIEPFNGALEANVAFKTDSLVTLVRPKQLGPNILILYSLQT